MRKGMVLIAFALSAAMVALFIFMGGMAAEMKEGEYHAVYQLDGPVLVPLIFEDMGDEGMILIFNDRSRGVVLSMDAEGMYVTEKVYEEPVRKAKVFGSDVYLLFDEDGITVRVKRLNIAVLEERDDYVLPVPYDYAKWIDCDAEGNIFFSKVNALNELSVCYADSGRIDTTDAGGRIEFLETYDGFAYLCAGGRWIAVDRNLTVTGEAECGTVPRKILDSRHFIDLNGLVVDYGKDKITPVFLATTLSAERPLIALKEQDLFWRNSTDTVVQYTLSGENEKVYHLEGQVFAVGKEAVIVLRDGELFSVRYASFSDMTPEPSVPPDELELPEGIDEEAGFLYFNAGITVKQLKELFSPQDITVRKETGEIVSSGMLRTGMRLSEYYIVIIGDCNGTGTVNSADMKEAQNMFLGESEKGSVYFKGTDIDRDGEVTTADLVLLSTRIG